MKRFWSTPEYVRQQRLRQRKHDRRRELRTSKPSRSGLSTASATPGTFLLRAPEILSVVESPAESLAFAKRFRQYLLVKETTVSLDLRRVTQFTAEMLLLIRALMDSPTLHRGVRGNLPEDPAIATEFKASGFFAGFTRPPTGLPAPKGLMLHHSRVAVHAEVAAQLVEFSMKEASIEPPAAAACYRTLVEVMTNTHNHATTLDDGAQTGSRVPWSASVYCRDGVAYFAFIDLGIGIAGSIPARDLVQRAGATISTYGRSHLLSDAFLGRLGSVTRKPGRGLGLPRIRQEAQRGHLQDLLVLTSDVVGAVADLDFRRAGGTLRGTLFRWRVVGGRS